MQVGSGFDPGIFTLLKQGGICLSGDISLDSAATLSLQNIYMTKDHVFQRLCISHNKTFYFRVT